jgi:hypothetical protein
MTVKRTELSAMRKYTSGIPNRPRFAAATPQETDYTPRDFISRYCTVNC